MFETILDEEERGQVGIGTLIVFIAMVLVAAIAAGVLINTAGFLQTQAEATGEESTSQVSDRLQIVSTSGDLGGGAPVTDLRFIVATAPGSSAIDLSQTTAQFIGSQGEVTVNVGDLSSNNGDDAINNIQGPSGTVLTDSSDRAELVFDLEDGSSQALNNEYGTLSEGERLTVVFTTSAGATTEKEIRVPTTIVSSDQSVRL
jgi:flagellin-like protein